MIGLKRSIDIRLLIATGDYRSVIALTFKDGSLKRTQAVKRKQTTKLLKYKKQAERYFDSFKEIGPLIMEAIRKEAFDKPIFDFGVFIEDNGKCLTI